MRLFVLYIYDSFCKRKNPWVRAQITKLRRKRRERLWKFADRHYPPTGVIESETLYLRRVSRYRKYFRFAIFLGIIVCTSFLLHIGGVI